MQHDPNDNIDRQGAARSGAQGASRSETDRLGANLGDTTGDRSASAFGETSGTFGRESLGGGESKVEQKAEHLKESAESTMRGAKEKAVNFKSTLADKLDAGAEKLRHKSASGNAAAVGEEAEGKVNKVGNKVASGMESTADWLRSADMDSIKNGLEEQVRSNPGRTLLVALGVGYLLGRAIRGKGEG